MDVYQQINEKCTVENIKSFLRDVQERSNKARAEINISGSKDDVISNLRRAVDERFAELKEVQQLLYDCEEVGKQHVLLLTPDPKAAPKAAIKDASQVATALFGDSKTTDLFPRYEYPSSGFVWADFRQQAGGWLAKAYGREIHRLSEGVVLTEDLGSGLIREIRQYKYQERKPTLVANWRPSPGILEVRIDISYLQNENTIEERRNELWTLLRPAFDSTHLLGLGIDKLLAGIINNRRNEEDAKRYSLGRIELMDPRSGLIRVLPSAGDMLDDDPGRTASLQAMLENEFKPSLVRIEWKSDADGCPKSMTEPVPVVIEKTSNGPELRILKRINQDTYEYVFNQLRIRL